MSPTDILGYIAFLQHGSSRGIRIVKPPLRSSFCGSKDPAACSTKERIISVPICGYEVIPRRHFLRTLTSGVSLSLLSTSLSPSEAQATINIPLAKPEDLVARIGQNASRRPVTHLFQDDIYYPDYFAGVWNTESTLVSVTCPAGYKLFGRPGSYENAQRVRVGCASMAKAYPETGCTHMITELI